MSIPNDPARWTLALLAGAILALTGCSGGGQKPILAATITARLAQDPPPSSDPVVYFGHVTAAGDILQMDVLVRDSTGALDVDDFDLVFRYDSTFIQVVSLTSQNALFGTCNTVNAACGLVSPVCADDRTAANGGQGSPGNSRYCRSDGRTDCLTTPCPTSGDACGVFGRLESAFAVVSGTARRVCSNNLNRDCSQDSDCQFCQGNLGQTCTVPADCQGTCDTAAGICSTPPGKSCTQDADCTDTCGAAGICQGCGSVIVTGTCVSASPPLPGRCSTVPSQTCSVDSDCWTHKLASLTLRVMTTGRSDFRFVVSSTSGTSGVSAMRKNVVDQPVQFFPNVDTSDPSIQNGSILIEGTK